MCVSALYADDFLRRFSGKDELIAHGADVTHPSSGPRFVVRESEQRSIRKSV
jgi:hypothetical protein